MNFEVYPPMHCDGKSYVPDALQIMRPACTTACFTTLLFMTAITMRLIPPFSSSAIYLASVCHFALFREMVRDLVSFEDHWMFYDCVSASSPLETGNIASSTIDKAVLEIYQNFLFFRCDTIFLIDSSGSFRRKSRRKEFERGF